MVKQNQLVIAIDHLMFNTWEKTQNNIGVKINKFYIINYAQMQHYDSSDDQ